MPEYTDNLKLFKYNTATDGKEVFSINEAMNHNWDILDKQPGTLKTNQITNCLLEVPQRVNVELNNGALTVKAGFVTIVPYGTKAPALQVGDPLNGGEIVDISWDGQKLFYFVKYTSDKVNAINNDPLTRNRFIFVNSNQYLDSMTVEQTFSSPTAPSTGSSKWALWYDTTNNNVKYTNDSGSSQLEYCTLPLSVGLNGSNGGESLDKVFNGFGFIGSTIWCDKGVKGLAADGRNADGTFNNIEFETDRVLIANASNGTRTEILLFDSENNRTILTTYYTPNYYESVYQPNHTMTETGYWWNPETGQSFTVDIGNQKWVQRCVVKLTTYNTTNTEPYQVTQYRNVKQPFRAVDYADTEFISHQAMPSDRYIGLTLGATGSTYTAPANGWYCVIKENGANGSYQFVDCHVMLPDYTPDGSVAPVSQYLYSVANSSTARNNGIHCLIPIRKGHLMQISYSATGVTQLFRFIYAQGAQGGS